MNLEFRILSEETEQEEAKNVATLQRDHLYNGTLFTLVPEEEIIRRATTEMQIENEDAFVVCYIKDIPSGAVLSVAHLKIRPWERAKEDEYLFIAPDTNKIILQTYGNQESTPLPQVHIGGAIVNPAYAGLGLGSQIMRTLTRIGLSASLLEDEQENLITKISEQIGTRWTLLRGSTGPYASVMPALVLDVQKQGGICQTDLGQYGIGDFPAVRRESIGSQKMAQEFRMKLTAIMTANGGPIYTLPVQLD